MAMTAAMRRLHEKLPPKQSYPLPPREITDRMIPSASQEIKSAATLLGHFGYGALAGALYACLPGKRMPAVIYGPLVWTASYFGWIPAAGILEPAHQHPARRNGLMILAHAVWGLALGLGLKELYTASERSFGMDVEPQATPKDAKAKPGTAAKHDEWRRPVLDHYHASKDRFGGPKIGEYVRSVRSEIRGCHP
ncbi:hypothetical protein [Pelagibacterium sp. H642]|uniref:hypothetical protein n=1 Tax=Pelagibacterium sp. H642 TaxID=1881069 RepID=UPI002815EEE3|nr:hypothetical protein [Pelagibacterium sp. H642]WMT92768.1 hypothetical protein NO934_18425 [Pelagibacterium sp. H642]